MTERTKYRLRFRLLLLVALLALIVETHDAPARKGNHYPPGCLRQSDVNIGYYPHEITRETVLRVQPRDDAPIIRRMELGRRFGIQSVPNPERLSDPGMPEPTDGYVWGYSKKGGRSGWVLADALVPTADGWADGPAHEDFEAGGVAVPRLRPVSRFTLGAAARGTVSIMDGTAYLRWAPRSSAMAIVLRGDRVRVLWRSSGHFCAVAGGRVGWLHVDTTSADY